MRKNKNIDSGKHRDTLDKPGNKILVPLISYLFLSVIVFWFLQKFCRYDYLFDEQFRMFRYSWNYAKPLLFSVGGISTYIADFLTQFYYWPELGALINTVFFFCSALGVFFIARKLMPNYIIPFFAVLCGLLVVVMETDLNYKTENTITNLLFLLAFNLILYAPKKSISFVVWILTSVVIGYITGYFLFVFFLGLVVFCLSSSKVLKYLEKFKNLLTPKSPAFRQILYILFCIAAFVVGLKFFQERHHNQSTRLKCLETMRWRKDWDGILSLPYMKVCPTTLYAAYQNLALANKGILGEKLDDYPQLGVEGLWYDNHGLQCEMLLLSDIFYAQGNVTNAQMLAFNGFSYSGELVLPSALLRLVETNLINGDYKVAEKYISLLEETLNYKKTATDYRKFLNHPELVEKDKVLGPLKKVTENLDGLSSDIVSDLKKIVAANPNYKTAKDYLDSYNKLSSE